MAVLNRKSQFKVNWDSIKVLIAAAGLVAISLLANCGPINLGTFDNGTAQEKAFAIDAVKLISSDITRGDDERTYTQPRYRVSPTARLLLRYESLSDKKTVLENKPLRLRIFGATADDAVALRASAKVCPVTKPWMMAASWTTAHPWRGGGWIDGGSIDDSECVSADAVSSQGLCAEAGAVCFDLTRWYKNWVVERPEHPENHGVALISNTPVIVIGDASVAKSPRIQWFESGATL